MNEDLKPCYDIETYWNTLPDSYGKQVQVSCHKDDKHLFRLIDFKKKTIEFRDTKRVLPINVIDIYRPLTFKERGEIMGLALEIIHKAKPITMPYTHEDLKMFIEYHADTVGFLFYKDSDEDHSIVPIKRYFHMIREPHLHFEEITWSEFYELSSDVVTKGDKHVDKNAE